MDMRTTMSLQDAEDLMLILGNNNIDYEWKTLYTEDLGPDGRYTPYIDGHELVVFGKSIFVWEIDKDDEEWNKGRW